MAFTFDAKKNVEISGNPSTTTFTCGAGATLLVVGITQDGGNGSTGTVTYNGLDMTLVEQRVASLEGSCELWYLLNPPTESDYTLSIPNGDGETSQTIISSYISDTGDTAYGTSNYVTGGNSADPTVTVGSNGADGSVFVDMLFSGRGAVPAESHSLLYAINKVLDSYAGQYYLQATADDVDMSWTLSADDWCMVACSFTGGETGETWSLGETINVSSSESWNITTETISESEGIDISDSVSFTPKFPWYELIGNTYTFPCAYVSEASTSIYGLDHLEGQTVSILANGEVLDEQVVVGGEIELGDYYSIVRAGLPYYADIETLKINVPLKGATMQGTQVKVGNVTFHLQNTRGGYIGPDEDDLWRAFTADEINRYAGSTLDSDDMYTGKLRQPLGANYGNGGHIFYRQVDPLPVTIGAIMPEVDIGGYAR